MLMTKVVAISMNNVDLSTISVGDSIGSSGEVHTIQCVIPPNVRTDNEAVAKVLLDEVVDYYRVAYLNENSSYVIVPLTKEYSEKNPTVCIVRSGKSE